MIFHKILNFFNLLQSSTFFSFKDKRILYTCHQFFDIFPRLCFLISLQHYLNYSLYQTIPSGVVNDAVRLRHLRKSFRTMYFGIVLGIVFAMDWPACYFQRCVSRPSSIRFRAGDSSLLFFSNQDTEDRDLYSSFCIFDQSKS